MTHLRYHVHYLLSSNTHDKTKFLSPSIPRTIFHFTPAQRISLFQFIPRHLSRRFHSNRNSTPCRRPPVYLPQSRYYLHAALSPVGQWRSPSSSVRTLETTVSLNATRKRIWTVNLMRYSLPTPLSAAAAERVLAVSVMQTNSGANNNES